MSRSTRKPYFTDRQGHSTKSVKRQATKRVRKLDIIDTPQNGKAYRRQFQSWHINDYSFYSPNHKKAGRK